MDLMYLRITLALAAAIVLAAACAAAAQPIITLAFYHDGQIYIVERETTEQPSPMLAAKLLLEGPTAQEAAAGVVSAIPADAAFISSTLDEENKVHIDVTRGYLSNGAGDAQIEAMGMQWFATFRQSPFVAGVIITVEGQPLTDFIKPAIVKERSPDALTPRPLLQGVAGKKIAISPGHGRYWNGSGWYYMRGQYCGYEEEDLRDLKLSIYLMKYLQNHGATIYMARQNDLNYGNSPYDGNRPWWQMASSYWLKYLGYPCSVYANSSGDCALGSGGSESSDDIRARPLMSDYENTDIYVSIHTNGLSGYCTGSGCPSGTETYYDASSEHATWGAISQQLGNAINPNVVSAINTALPEISPDWSCHGTCVKDSSGNYGEIRIPDRAATLTELGFHDTCDRDAALLNDNFFRSVAMWGMYKGICSFFGDTASPMYNAEYVSDDFPTNAVQGETHTYHVTFRNKGVVWSDARNFHLGAVGDSDPFTTTIRQQLTGEVSVNDTFTFSVQLTFGAAGTYTTDWRMVRDGFTWFGQTFSKTITVTPSSDTEPPTVPQNLRITGRRVAGVDLAWNASTDNVLLGGYRILRNGAPVGTTTSTTYTDSGLTSGATYEWRVEAYDVVPNYSAPSSPVSGSTAVPSNLRATRTTYYSVNLAWDVSPGAIGVSGYRIYRDGVVVGSTSGTAYTDSPLDADTSYVYQVDAYDAVPNYSIKSNTITAHTDQVDTTPPSIPLNLKTSAITRSTVTLDWSPSTDDYGVTGYNVFRNNAVVATVTGTHYIDHDIDAGTACTYEVSAFDAAGNQSARSAPAYATTNSGGVFLDGFDGGVSNWTLETGIAFQYSTDQNHGTLPGAGSAYAYSGSAHLMYHWLDPRASLTAGGYKTGICEGWLYDTQGSGGTTLRSGLRLFGYDWAGNKQVEYWIGTYSATPFPTHYMAAVWAGSYTYYDLGVRSVGWHKLGIEVLPYTGSNDLRFYVDGELRATVSQPAQAADSVLRRLYMGYAYNVMADSYLDDISFDCARPEPPSELAGTAVTTNSIRWTFTDNADNELGFRVYDGASKVAEREVMNASYIDETGIPANTICTRTARAFVGEVESADSAPATACTLSTPPTGFTVYANPAPNVWTTGALQFTSLVPFGPGGVQYYRYALDQSPTHTWTGAESVWNSGILEVTPASNGADWYVHLRGYNACDVANGSLDLGPFRFNADLRVREVADGTLLKLSGKVVSAAYLGAFYVVEIDRVSGIKVLWTTPVQIGDIVDVIGTMQTADGERYLQASSVTVR